MGLSNFIRSAEYYGSFVVLRKLLILTNNIHFVEICWSFLRKSFTLIILRFEGCSNMSGTAHMTLPQPSERVSVTADTELDREI